MIWPWEKNPKEKRIEDLEIKIDELREENRRLEERMNAEEERRAEASHKKQEAEKEVKQLETRIETLQNKLESKSQDRDRGSSFEDLELSEAIEGLQKLDSVHSDSEDLLSVIAPGSAQELDGYRELKNTVSARYTGQFHDIERFVCFTDGSFFRTVLRTKPIFGSLWKLSGSFETSGVLSEIEREKTWVVVSAGSSRVIREKGGEILEDEKIETRVNHQHSQGGFSQGRFERKREEQIEEHLELVRQSVEDDSFFVVGEERLAKELDGEYVGGFDPDRPIEDALYGFQIRN